MLLGRIELPTSSLPMTRSTTELQQHTQKVGPMRRDGAVVKRLAPLWAIWHRVREQAEWIGEGTWQKTRKTKNGLRPNGCAKPCARISAAAKQSRKAQNRTLRRHSRRTARQGLWQLCSGSKRKRTPFFQQRSARVALRQCRRLVKCDWM